MDSIVGQLTDSIISKIHGDFVLCGIYSGGSILGERMIEIMKSNGLHVPLYFIKLNKGVKYTIANTNLPLDLPSEKIIIFLDDAIWTGRTQDSVVDYVKTKYPKHQYKFATLLDCSDKADFAVF